ncbi:MAG: hypothetical protein HY033_02635 [Ignavibacteriae bacterium]|nr:hypothetical protein [Ignavibacteriota bacterium]
MKPQNRNSLNSFFTTNFKRILRITQWATRLNVIALISLLLGIANIITTCSHQREIDFLQYQQNALQYRPRIEVKDVRFHIDLKNIKFEPQDIQKKHLTLVIPYDSVQVDLKIKNTGSAFAKITGVVSFDSMVGVPILRMPLLFQAEPNKIRVSEWNGYFSEISLMPEHEDSLTITVGMKLIRDPGQTGTFHVLLLYENDLGTLFDTYLWVVFRVGVPSLSSVKTINDSVNNKTRFIVNSNQVSREMILLGEKRTDFKIYLPEEKTKLYSFFDDVERHQSK